MTDNELKESLELLPVATPEPGFADRVMARHSEAAAPRRARKRPSLSYRWIAVAVAAVLALILLPLRSSKPVATSGAVATDSRQSVKIGSRAVAVAEADSQLHWDVEASGRAVVGQSAGNVFYRVEPGEAFLVRTPGGDIRVLGTSFRVEVLPMQKKWQFAAGAIAGAVTVVTLYEGRVLFANSAGEVRLEPGEAAVAAAGHVPEKTAALLQNSVPMPAPDASATREQLLERDTVQRQEIASLRARVKDLEKSAPTPGSFRHHETDADGRPWFSPSEETLKSFVADCRIRFDTPNFFGTEPYRMSAEAASELGLNLDEWEGVNQAMQTLQKRTQDQIRALYLEVATDPKSADNLSASAMENEIQDRADETESALIRKKIAMERARMAVPPTDLSQLSPLERLLRLKTSLGDETERAMTQVIGKERAHQMRSSKGGYGSRSEMAGCGEDDQGP
jgi:hypothetical protein